MKILSFWFLFIIWSPIYALYYASTFRPERYLAFGAFYSTVFVMAGIFFPAPMVLFMRSMVDKINHINNKSTLVSTISRKFESIGMNRSSKIVCMTMAMVNKNQKNRP